MPDDGTMRDQSDFKTVARRNYLKAAGLTAAMGGLAGCGGGSNSSGSGSDESSGGESGGGDDGSSDSDDGPSPGERVPEIDFVTWTSSGFPTVHESGRIIATQLEELGLSVNLGTQQYPQPIIATLFESREFDMANIVLAGQLARLDPSFYLFNAMHSSNADPGGWNIPGYKNDEFDEMSVQQQETLDQDERQEIVYELQQMVFDQEIWTPYASSDLDVSINTNRFQLPDNIAPGEGLESVFTLTNIESNGDSTTFSLRRQGEQFRTFNPVAMQDRGDIVVNKPIYDALMRIGPDATPQNWIINEVTFEDDTTVLVELMDGLTFHDGEAVTPEDVVYSYELQKELQSPYVFTYLQEINSVEADGMTVRFNLENPYAPLTTLTFSQVPIIPKHIWEDIDDPMNHRNRPPIGSGPFEYNRVREGELLELDAVDDHPHSPSIDKLQFVLYGNLSSAQQALLNGDIDAAQELSSNLHGALQDSDSIEFTLQPNHGLQAVLHNIRQGAPFDDPAFRRAVSHALPRERIAEQIMAGSGSAAGSVIVEANEFWHNPDITPRTYDVEQARGILEDAGYSWDDDGRLLLPDS